MTYKERRVEEITELILEADGAGMWSDAVTECENTIKALEDLMIAMHDNGLDWDKLRGYLREVMQEAERYAIDMATKEAEKGVYGDY